MYYWIVIVFVIATMLGLNVSKKDDYRDTVLMPKIEPVVSRAITQHNAAYKYFQASYTANADNKDSNGNLWPEVANIVVQRNSDNTPVRDAAGNEVKKNMVIKHINSGTFPTGALGSAQLQNFAPYGFDFTNRDPEYDPITRFICIDRDAGTPVACNSYVLNKVNTTDKTKYDPDGIYKSVGYLVTYMPIPSMWDTPYYHNMIVNSIKRMSDNTLRFGIVKALMEKDGSGYKETTIDASNWKSATARVGSIYDHTQDNVGNIYTIGIPKGSKRAIYTVLDEVAASGRVSAEGLTQSNLIGVFTFIPDQIAVQAKTDFPSRKCGDSKEKKDINGMLMFIHRITSLENEKENPDPDDVLITKSNSVKNAFCSYTSSDEDTFYDIENVFSKKGK